MSYAATVYVGEKDPVVALEKAHRIYDMLGPEFFLQRPEKTKARIILWISRTLQKEDLCVSFNDASDAMLFKLAFGGS